MTLTTEPGQGSVFTIRLPFTVSVNRALMVYSGEDLYAIPLNTIEGIVRVSGYELEAYYAYLAMAAWSESEDYPGIATWMKNQAQEELFHMMKLFNFLAEAGVTMEMKPLAAPKNRVARSARMSSGDAPASRPKGVLDCTGGVSPVMPGHRGRFGPWAQV